MTHASKSVLTEPHLYRRAATVFAILVALSVIAWFVVNSPVYTSWELVGCALLVVGLFKAWLVGYDFMEIRHAPVVLRAAFLVWLLVTGASLLAIALV